MKIAKINLKQPYWSGWKKYGWEEKVPAFGIALHKIKQADVIVVSYQGGNYTIESCTALQIAEKYHSYFKTSTGLILVELPRTAFTYENRQATQ